MINRFINLVGEITPENVLSAGVDAIRGCGISRKKAEYILELSVNVIEEKYDFSLLDDMNDNEAVKYLMQIKSVGKWTSK